MAPPDDSPTSEFSGLVYRVVQRGVDPLSTVGSGRNGGRYNSPGDEGILYTSFEKETCIDEVAKGLRARGVDPRDYRPEDWWLYELEVAYVCCNGNNLHIFLVFALTFAIFLGNLGARLSSAKYHMVTMAMARAGNKDTCLGMQYVQALHV